MNKPQFSYQTISHLDNWEEGLYNATQEFLNNGVFSSFYLKEIVDVIHQHGPYMAITEDTVVLHAQKFDYVNTPFIAYLYAENSVHFFGKHIHHIFVFGADNEPNHLTLLSTISFFISELKDNHTLKSEDAMIKWLHNHIKERS